MIIFVLFLIALTIATVLVARLIRDHAYRLED